VFAVHGLFAGIIMIAFFIAINQIEGHVVIPLVMGHNLEMRPITVLLSILVGHQLAGIIGIIVAVPVCRMLGVLLDHGLQIYNDVWVKPQEAAAAAEAARAGAEAEAPAEVTVTLTETLTVSEKVEAAHVHHHDK
jgi:hypothetical protein